MEEPVIQKKSRRKVRCTQEFNQFNRISLVASASRNDSVKKSVTKKNKNLFYLPQVDFNLSASKENSSPNIGNGSIKKSKKRKTKSNNIEEMKLGNTEISPRITRSGKSNEGTSTEEEKRDSEVEFKKKRKRKKKNRSRSEKELSSEMSSEHEIQIFIDNKVPQEADVLSEIKTVNNIDDDEGTKRKSLVARKSGRFSQSVNKNESEENFNDHSRPQKLDQLDNNGHIDKTTNVIKNAPRKSLLLQRKNSVIQDIPNKKDILNKSLNAIPKKSIDVRYSNSGTTIGEDELKKRKSLMKRASYTLQNGIKDFKTVDKNETITRKSLILRKSSTFSRNKDDNQSPRRSNKSVNVHSDKNSDSESRQTLSRVIDIELNNDDLILTKSIILSHVTPKKIASNRPSNYMTTNSSSKTNRFSQSSPKLLENLNNTYKTTNKTSSAVKRKSSSRNTESLAPTPENSQCLSDDVFTSGEDLSETLECIEKETTQNKRGTFELQSSTFNVSELPIVNDQKPERVEKRRSKSLCDSSTISNRKSVTFMTPNPRSKREHKDSSSSSFGQHTRKTLTGTNRKSVRFSTVDGRDSSIIWLDQSSKSYPKSPHVLKHSSTFNFSKEDIRSETDPKLSKSLDENNDLGHRPSEYICKKRKQWNRSLGVSILDGSGTLHTVSPPWKEELLNSSDNCNVQSDTSRSSLSPIKAINSPKKLFLNSIKKSDSVKKIRDTTEELVKTISPIRKESSKHLRFDTNIETSKPNNKSTAKRTKLPNFALIHQKAFDKLENLKEMSERKALRAQQLLSGKKPRPETSLNVPSPDVRGKPPTLKIKSPKSRKLLKYSPKKSPLDKTKKLQGLAPSMVVSKTKAIIKPSTSNPGVIAKPVEKKIVVSRIPKVVKVDKIGFSKFKTAPEDTKVSRLQQVKSVATKTQPKINSVENRREIVQKVRTNRRFELLMKMRTAKN